MGEPDNRLAEVSFTSEELVKLFVATFVPLCELLEKEGVIAREKIAGAMSFYVQPDEVSSSAAMVAALQIALRGPFVEPGVDLACVDLSEPRARPEMRVIDGGLSRPRSDD
jgi:hypothetical protein